jgi:formylglycine-generating enzyme required for sulfatase activity
MIELVARSINAMLSTDSIRRLFLALLLSTIYGLPSSASLADEAELLATFRGEFVEITPGEGRFPKTFLMGRADGDAAERPVHEVTFTHRFAVARYEVPQNLWQAIMGGNPSRWKGPRNSVEMLSFDDAVEFCKRITQRLRDAKLISSSHVVRLPSEAEWEYVTRADTTTLYSFGDDVAELNDHAWSTRNAAGNDPPVGAKRPNAWGLYDVHGYLWEWCADTWHDNYSGAPADGSAWTATGAAGQGVLRSGSWKDPAEKLTSSFRRAAPRGLKDDAVGLRCVLAGGRGE